MKYYYTNFNRIHLLLLVCFSFLGFGASAQLGGTISSNTTAACAGSGNVLITFTAVNGTGPYSFSYQVNGSLPITIVSSTSDATISMSVNTPGAIVCQLISVEDANETATVNQSLTINVVMPPNVSAGPDLTICEGQTVTLTGTGATSYLWSNGVTGNQAFVPTVTATYTVTGSNGLCTNTDQVTITVLPFLPPAVTANIDSAICHDGSIALNITGNGPFNILWQLGATSALVTALDAGSYSAGVVDANGCTTSMIFTVPQSLIPADCGTVSGSVHYDQNQNCVADPADGPIINRMIVANPGNYVTFTDLNGNYSLNLNPGNYTIEEIFPNNFGPMCTASYPVTLAAAQTIFGLNFLDTANSNDRQIVRVLSSVLFGGNFTMLSTISDLSGYNGLSNVSAWFTIPAGTTMNAWAYPHTISNDTVYYHVNTTSSNFTAYVSFSTGSLALGSPVTSCAGISADIDLTNNQYCISGIVAGPYDPNDIRMFLNGTLSDSTILETDASLEYMIRFQNTGTAEAVNVYVLDTISVNLDLTSLQLISSSHPCQLSMLDDRTLRFNFPQIHLADSNTNEPASHGFIRYKIRQNPANTIGTVINNTAYIYFDFNEAVVTNTTYDIIVSELGTETKTFSPQLSVFPNPSDSKLNVRSEVLLLSLKLYSISGQVMQSEAPDAKDHTMELSGLSKGVYLLSVETDKGTIIKKIQKL